MNEETNLADAADVISAAQVEYDNLSEDMKQSAPFVTTDKDGNLVQLDDNKKQSRQILKDEQGSEYELTKNRGQVRVRRLNS